MKVTVRVAPKWLLRFFLAGMALILLTGGFYGVKGYMMYQDAITEKSIEERVEELRSREDYTAYSELPQFYIQATISVEDRRFEDHHGIDLVAILRAAWRDIKTMSFAEGGSTITQQLAKNMLFTKEKKLERKAAEVFAVLEIESEYTKEEIFELYVNLDYFGNGYDGICQAARGYFEKEPSELTDYESVVLAGVLNAPSAYSPDKNKTRVLERGKQVLKCMVRDEIITQDEADEIAEKMRENQ